MVSTVACARRSRASHTTARARQAEKESVRTEVMWESDTTAKLHARLMKCERSELPRIARRLQRTSGGWSWSGKIGQADEHQTPDEGGNRPD